jgi:hypothetical protein
LAALPGGVAPFPGDATAATGGPRFGRKGHAAARSASIAAATAATDAARRSAKSPPAAAKGFQALNTSYGTAVA